jgi:glycosyltransferase involved in cell wall biosynthesis
LTLLERHRKDVSGKIKKVDRFPYIVISSKGIGTILKLQSILFQKLFRILRKRFIHRSKPDLRIGDYDIGFEKIRIYQEIDADIYCTFGVGNMTAEIAAFCKRYAKLLVLFTGSGSDFSDEYYCGSKSVNPYGSIGALCHYAIMQSDFVITQTYTQKQLFEKKFKKESTVILNPIDLSKHESSKANFLNERFALWIGKSDQVKRPEMLIRLALHFKEIKFMMILNRSDASIYEKIISSRPRNVEIMERCPLPYTEKLFSEAFVLINTSLFEGFPNTFLQAGKYGVPILSLSVDPDDFIKKYSCGIVADGHFDKFSDGLRIILNQKEKAKEFCDNINKYVSRYHDLQHQIRKLDNFFKGINERENPQGI